MTPVRPGGRAYPWAAQLEGARMPGKPPRGPAPARTVKRGFTEAAMSGLGIEGCTGVCQR